MEAEVEAEAMITKLMVEEAKAEAVQKVNGSGSGRSKNISLPSVPLFLNFYPLPSTEDQDFSFLKFSSLQSWKRKR